MAATESKDETSSDISAAAAEPMKQKAHDVAEQQKKAGAEWIVDVAGAIHGAAHELESQMPPAAGYIHDAASRLEGAAAALREHSIDDLMHSFGDFARRQPLALFGGAMLAGFAMSRFLKSSAGTAPDRN
jgi:hypothetical protein